MSDAVHRTAPNRLVRGLTGAVAVLGLTGGACAMALSSGGVAGAAAAHATHVAAAPLAVRTAGTSDSGNWFACVAFPSINYGICVGPPTSS